MTWILTFDLDLVVKVGHHYGRPLTQITDKYVVIPYQGQGQRS